MFKKVQNKNLPKNQINEMIIITLILLEKIKITIIIIEIINNKNLETEEEGNRIKKSMLKNYLLKLFKNL